MKFYCCLLQILVFCASATHVRYSTLALRFSKTNIFAGATANFINSIKVLRKGIVTALFCLFLAFASLLPSQAYASAEDDAVYKQQSLFLYKFLSFVKWPKVVYEGDIKVVDLCIYGADNLTVIDQIAAKAQTLNKTKLNVRRGVGISDISTCNIAYISDSKKGDLSAILSAAAKYPVLTVSEVDGAAKAGAAVEFVISDNTLRFVINNKAADAVGLQVDSDLLEIALEVIK
jgi:hypothetical protein